MVPLTTPLLNLSMCSRDRDNSRKAMPDRQAGKRAKFKNSDEALFAQKYGTFERAGQGEYVARKDGLFRPTRGHHQCRRSLIFCPNPDSCAHQIAYFVVRSPPICTKCRISQDRYSNQRNDSDTFHRLSRAQHPPSLHY
jgi:hypothetical protein